MQQNPIITGLRYIGFTIGAVLFVTMVYRSGQMAGNPIYVKGKPFFQQLSSATVEQPTASTTADRSAVSFASEVTDTPQPSGPQNTQVVTAAAPAPVPSEKAKPVAPDKPAPQGKALGQAKHLN